MVSVVPQLGLSLRRGGRASSPGPVLLGPCIQVSSPIPTPPLAPPQCRWQRTGPASPHVVASELQDRLSCSHATWASSPVKGGISFPSGREGWGLLISTLRHPRGFRQRSPDHRHKTDPILLRPWSLAAAQAWMSPWPQVAVQATQISMAPSAALPSDLNMASGGSPNHRHLYGL